MTLTRIVETVLLGTLCCTSATVTVFHLFGFVAKVDGVSMRPTINPEPACYRDWVLVNKWTIRNNSLRHGDVIALISPKRPKDKLIKRVVALEGDTVRTQRYKEPEVVIPRGHCWVEGDNRFCINEDSNNFGPVSMGLVTAKITHIVWPPGRIGRLSTSFAIDRDRFSYVTDNTIG